MYQGTGDCIRDMTNMYWTGLVVYTGLSQLDRSGSWSGFDQNLMGLQIRNGTMISDKILMSGSYLTMAQCEWISGVIVYP